jgi:hypothetical protein
MEINVWQQFSSNHSNSFTVVGQFPSEADADKAAATLRELFENIYLQGIGYHHEEPLQAELDCAAEYNLQWEKHLDWIDELPDWHVTQFENLLLIGNAITWQGATVIDQLVARLGAAAYKQEELSNDAILLNIHAEAPDANAAAHLHTQIQTYLEANNAYWQNNKRKAIDHPIPPWAFHFGNKPDMPPESIVALFKQNAALQDEIKNISEQIHQLGQVKVDDTNRRMAALLEKRRALDETSRTKPNGYVSGWFHAAITHTALIEDYPDDPIQRVSHLGKNLTIENLSFGSTIADALPALVHWLRDLGCTVQYSFHVERLQP